MTENVACSCPRRGTANLAQSEFMVLAPSLVDERQTANRKCEAPLRHRLRAGFHPKESTTGTNTKQPGVVIHVTDSTLPGPAHRPGECHHRGASDTVVALLNHLIHAPDLPRWHAAANEITTVLLVRSICVFSGASPGGQAEYAAAAQELGAELAARHIRLVYGGASVGLMGVVADSALAAGGEVIGVIPQQLVDREVVHRGLSDLRITSSMHERKALMAELSDGFVALPGGYGTLEEFAEVLTWSQLGLQCKPCGLLNVADFYRPLLEFFDHAVNEQFVCAEHRDLILADTDAARLLDALDSWVPLARVERPRGGGEKSWVYGRPSG